MYIFCILASLLLLLIVLLRILWAVGTAAAVESTGVVDSDVIPVVDFVVDPSKLLLWKKV